MTDEEWRALDERADRRDETARERWLARMENEMDTGDVGASSAPEIESSEETQAAMVAEGPAPSLPTLPEPDDNDRMALEAALKSPAPVVVIPAAFNRPAADNQDVIAFATRCRRVIAPVGDQLVAVRPKPSCRTCNGSARWTLIVKGQRRACACVIARIDEAAGVPSKHRSQPAAPPAQKPAAPSTMDAGRAARLAEMEERLRSMQAQRDAALVPIEERIEAHAHASLRLTGQLSALADDQGELAAEKAQRERMAKHYEELARAERASVATIEAALAEKREAERPLRLELAGADLAVDQVRGERERVIARWDERMRPTARAIERLREKLGATTASEEAAS